MILFQMYVLSFFATDTEIVNKHDALVLLEQLTFCITVKTSMAEKWHCL